MNKQLTFFNKKASKKTLEKIKPLLASITNSRDMKIVEDFWEKVSNYFGILFGIDNAIEDGQIGEEAASKYVIDETNAILLEAKKLEESLHNSDLIRKIKKLFRECGIPVGMKSEIYATLSKLTAHTLYSGVLVRGSKAALVSRLAAFSA